MKHVVRSYKRYIPTHYHKPWITIQPRLFVAGAFIALLVWALFHGHALAYDRAHPLLVPEFQAININPGTLSPTNQYEQIRDYIIQVFGKDAPVFLNILQNPKCSENRGLRPAVINDNRSWGGIGVDVGIGQVNAQIHGIAVKWLKNWKVNILISKQIWDESGSSAWTCGRYLKQIGEI
jgi:hypothetical protein